MRLQKGFSLMELMIVVVIIGIMASFGMASFSKRLEKDKFRKAVENMKVIYNIERRYNLENGSYFPKVAGTGDTLALINTGLELTLRDGDFSYNVTGVKTGSIITGYKVTLTRLSGKCKNKTITLTQAGGEPTIPVACSRWE